MDQNEQAIINGLFDKLSQAEQRTGPRDGEAERLIGERLGTQPAAPYYMAQAILVQEQALQAANDRITQLEQELQQRPAGGGFLGGLFGGGEVPGKPQPSAAQQRLRDYQQRGGGGFLGGAMQTALGVAGGVVLGNLLMGAFAADDAAAGEADPFGGEPMPEEDPGAMLDDPGDFEF
jgi:hypothetical protein